MDQKVTFMVILGMAVVTYIPRLIPALSLSSRSLNPVLVRWLSFIPTAVLSAMLVPSLLLMDGQINLTLDNFFFWASIPCLALAFRTGSFFGTVALGMGLIAAARYFLL